MRTTDARSRWPIGSDRSCGSTLPGGPAYTIPPDNPFVDTPGAKPEIWSYGLRNPWRFSFDRSTGDLYIGDVGEHHWEEVDVGRATENLGRGANYGWSRMEGHDCLQAGCDQSGITFPYFEYGHEEVACAITGAYVYRGAAIPRLQGGKPSLPLLLRRLGAQRPRDG